MKSKKSTRKVPGGLSQNIIAFQRGGIVPPNDSQNNKIEVSTVQHKLIGLGYIFTQEAFEAMSKAHVSWIVSFEEEITPWLEDQLGKANSNTTLYKGFPQEVMEKSASELLYNALSHYWSNGKWEPQTVAVEAVLNIDEKITYTKIDAWTEDKFDEVFTLLTGANQSLTPQDTQVIGWFAKNRSVLKYAKHGVPFKENLCLLAAMKLPGLPVKTTVDVLRIAVHLSGGDISLPALPSKMYKPSRWSNKMVPNPAREEAKFRKFKRPERRYLLGLLENSNCDPREMVLRKGRWIRLGEILHPGEMKAQYPRAHKAFKALRNMRVQSWFGQVNDKLKSNFIEGLAMLATRPGVFARRIDELVRKNPMYLDEILQAFSESVQGTSNKVLFEVYTHFTDRDKPSQPRSIKIKSSRSRTELPRLPALSTPTVETIQSQLFNGLATKFAKLEPLGAVYIDPALKKIPLPTDMRTASASLKPVIRGQAISFDNPDTKVFRAFVHWLDPYGSEDLDLSCTFVGKRREVLSYSTSGLRVGKCVHSGDVRRRVGKCAEYVDIDIADALSNGFKYAMISVYNFNGRGLDSVQSKFGFMEREAPKVNSHWLPETVKNTFEFASPSASVMAVIIDIERRSYVIIDEDFNGSPFASGTDTHIATMLEQYMRDPKVSVYDLIYLHATARGKVVTESAPVIDTVFLEEDFKYSYEKTLELMGV